jgi:nucleotide-binding universal stress UspA family protein
MRTMALAALVAAVALAGCGGDDSESAGEARPVAGTDLGAIKAYLLEHTAALGEQTAALAADAEAYHAAAEQAGFDYGRLLSERRADVASLVERMQATYVKANPAYEEMEGVVAGVPELADFDVIIDAGGDKSDPENAVPFSIKTPAGRTFEQPGNFMFLAETALWGTEPQFAARGTEADLDGDDRVAFGEALPDADFLVAMARDFAANARELDAAAKAWTPTDQDAFTALVVMTPTMSEYFEAWKNSRFVSGADADESAFVAASRLQDIADILGGLVLVYENVQPAVADADPQQARQTAAELRDLRDFAARLRDEEAGGRRFTARDADTLGSEAQDRAEAIAGQVSQAAGRLGITLEN